MSGWHLEGDMAFTVGQRSSAGQKEQNEDAIGIRIPKGELLSSKGAVAVIADGVSAAEAGKEASETCVHNFLSDYYSTPDTWSVGKSTTQVLTALNRWLYSQGRRFTDAQKGYVSTLSSVIFKSHTAHIFHVGDTRIYRLRAGELEQLTRDHSTYINDTQSYLARAMGLDVKLDVDYRSVDIDVGDIFFLSTDGIHDFVNDGDIRRALVSVAGQSAKEEQLELCCQTLITQALENDSGDNLSCQVLRVDCLPSQNIDDVYQKLTTLPFPPNLEPGMTLDGYNVIKTLHESSRSQVYLVQDIATDKQYCMKTPSVNYEDEPAYIERFIVESWIGSRINNPHVVKVVETNKKKNFLYYLTEHIEGITLARWIKENPKPPVQDVIYLVEQIIKGLRALHRRETLHQDIKPGNIMIDKHGEAKIIDFGSCYISGIAEISTPLERDGVLGTASYSAPEVVLRGVSTAQSDIFSLAVIVFEMLTGKKPFEGKLSECKTTRAYLKTKYIPSDELNPLVPIWVDGAVKKALRFDPSRRYEDISEFLHELTHPNPKYRKSYSSTLMDKDPVFFWQVSSGVLLLALLVSLYFNLM
ncbi:serine/threonine protein kinase [Gammaproteobacteria bacterium 45_16_T64]|nr:serine/threonine protein kinase [Gammaproteobacteria bacterium 45_16_T64]